MAQTGVERTEYFGNSFQVLRVARVGKVDVEGRERRSVDGACDTTDDDEVDTRRSEPLEDRDGIEGLLSVLHGGAPSGPATTLPVAGFAPPE